jgi:hypothetical protein
MYLIPITAQNSVRRLNQEIGTFTDRAKYRKLAYIGEHYGRFGNLEILDTLQKRLPVPTSKDDTIGYAVALTTASVIQAAWTLEDNSKDAAKKYLTANGYMATHLVETQNPRFWPQKQNIEAAAKTMNLTIEEFISYALAAANGILDTMSLDDSIIEDRLISGEPIPELAPQFDKEYVPGPTTLHRGNYQFKTIAEHDVAEAINNFSKTPAFKDVCTHLELIAKYYPADTALTKVAGNDNETVEFKFFTGMAALHLLTHEQVPENLSKPPILSNPLGFKINCRYFIIKDLPASTWGPDDSWYRTYAQKNGITMTDFISYAVARYAEHIDRPAT